MRCFTLGFLLLFIIVNAQETDSTFYKWIPSAIAGLNISQISFKNWQKGGDNSLSWTVTSDLELKYKTENWKLVNKFKAAFGRTKLGGNNYRTNDNDLFFETVYSYNIGWEVNPFVSNSFRSTITEGFDYEQTPIEKTADFLDPGYVTQSIGFTYDKAENFTTRLGVAFQEVFTNEMTQYTDDPNTARIEKFKMETGIEPVTEGQAEVMENILYKGKLRLFSRFESLDVWDVRWDNVFVAKVNSVINVNFSFLLIYEKEESIRTQMKETLQVGIVYRII